MEDNMTRKRYRPLLTIREAAGALGVHPNTLRNWDRSGKLPAIKTAGGHRRYSIEAIAALAGKPAGAHLTAVLKLVALARKQDAIARQH